MTRHMLDRDRDERGRKRLESAHIADSILPLVTLFDDFAKFLNETRTHSGKRIIHILEQMLDLEQISRPIKGVVWADLSLKKSDPERFNMLREIQKKNAYLKKELRGYRFIPCAAVIVGGGGIGASEWGAYWRWSSKKYEKHLRLSAGQALQVMLKLTQIGYLNRLRHCAHCGKWLYARFRHQSFCSVKCQQKQYTQSEEWKTHRRAYMRRYYQKNFSGKPR
jgi:hypothetical protein